MIVAIAFVPVQHIEEAINQLGDNLPGELLPVLDYFEDTYLGRVNRRGDGRRSPTFEPSMWSVYERILNGQDRTNNLAEAAHRRLQCELGVTNPTLWRFIEGLRKIQYGRDFQYEQLVAGQNPPTKQNKFIEADIRIINIVKHFSNRNILEYLRGIAHNYQMDT